MNVGRAVQAGHWDEKKGSTGQEKSQKVIFHLFGEKPPLKRYTSKIV